MNAAPCGRMFGSLEDRTAIYRRDESSFEEALERLLNRRESAETEYEAVKATAGLFSVREPS